MEGAHAERQSRFFSLLPFEHGLIRDFLDSKQVNQMCANLTAQVRSIAGVTTAVAKVRSTSFFELEKPDAD